MTLPSVETVDSSPGGPGVKPEKIQPSSEEENPVETWNDFIQNTTFHGVRYVFQDSSVKFRRPLWLTVVIAAILLFVIQVGIRTSDYLQYRTTVNVDVIYTDKLDFPAVTICNQNTYRITSVVKWELYHVIDEVFRRTNISEIDWDLFHDAVVGIDFEEFTLTSAHQKLNFLHRCKWNFNPCDIDNDFKTIATDLGVCYMFNGNLNQSARTTTETGAASGLSLLINIEQYEYMRGPQNDAGVKILVHSRNEKPVMKEQGFAAAPGTHTLVAIQLHEVESMEPPYGTCNANHQPVSQCVAECYSREATRICGCRDIYMPVFNKTKICGLKGALSCIQQELAKLKRSKYHCQCESPCSHLKYEPQLSYAQLSKFNIDRMVLDNVASHRSLKDSYLMAREISHKYTEVIASKDKEQITEILKVAHQLHKALLNTTRRVEDPYSAAEHYGLPLIFDPVFFHEDRAAIERSLSQTVWNKFEFPRLPWSLEYNFFYGFLELEDLKSEFREFLLNCNELMQTSVDLNQTDGSGDDQEEQHVDNTIAADYGSTKCKERILKESKEMIDWLEGETDYLMKETEIDLYEYEEIVTDGSGDDQEEQHVDNTTAAVYCSTKCKEKIVKESKELIDWLEWKADNLMKETEIDLSEYEKIVTLTFANTTKSVEDFEEHEMCLLGMETLSSNLKVLKQLTDEYKNEAKSLRDYLNLTEQISDWYTQADMESLTQNITHCEWVQNRLSTYVNSEENLHYRMRLAQQGHSRLLSSFEHMSRTLVQLTVHFEVKTTPVLQKITGYLNGNNSKMDLSMLLHLPITRKALSDMIGFGIDASTVVKDTLIKLSEMKRLLPAIYTIVADSPVPFMDNHEIRNLNLVKQALATNASHFVQTVDTLEDDLSKNLESLIVRTIEAYSVAFSSILEELLTPLQEMADKLSRLQDDLKEFAEASELNAPFFMDNFLQVDIFYQELSYEKIQQQPSFGLLSLLGEVGGFMGLLLGASIMTVCELLDYAIVNAIKQFASHRKVVPAYSRTTHASLRKVVPAHRETQAI